MASSYKSLANMRTQFRTIDKTLIHWFPGHMNKGIKQIERKLSQIDCIIEVHDARIPFSGRNPNLTAMTAMKPHILVLNKKDLLPRRHHEKVKELLYEQNVKNVIYTNCKDYLDPGVKKIFSKMNELISTSDRYNRSEVSEYLAMIIGVPNVGKSSLINLLRNKNLKMKSASAVGAQAGVTRSVLNRIKISEKPYIYLLDTPGILPPKVEDINAGLKLALSGCLLDHLVGDEIIADFLLYLLNKRGNFSYVEKMGLKEPTDNITEALACRAVHAGDFRDYVDYTNTKTKIPNISASAKFMIKSFRAGDFGKMFLDEDIAYPPDESQENKENQ